MNSLAFGIALLLGLVGYQWGMRHWRSRQLQQAWQEAQEALQTSEPANAEIAARRCVRLEPLFVAGRQILAHALALQGQLEQAEEEYRMAVQLQPRQAMGHFHLGLFYAQFRPEQQDAALAALREAVAHDPEATKVIAQHQARFGLLAQRPEFRTLLEGR